MKKCSRCSKPATLHITEVRSGSVQALHHFCEGCAHEFLKNPQMPESLDDVDLLAEKIAEVAGEHELDELDRIVCPNCGISFREFRSQGRLGCPHDYEAFQRELTPLLENIHGESRHVGKFPKRAPDGSERQYRLIKMRNELRTAIEEEAYERAAKLRDEIQALETDLASSSDLT